MKKVRKRKIFYKGNCLRGICNKNPRVMGAWVRVRVRVVRLEKIREDFVVKIMYAEKKIVWKNPKISFQIALFIQLLRSVIIIIIIIFVGKDFPFFF